MQDTLHRQDTLNLVDEARELLIKALPLLHSPVLREAIAAYLVIGSIPHHTAYSKFVILSDVYAGSVLAGIEYILKGSDPFGVHPDLQNLRKFLVTRMRDLRKALDFE